MNKTKKSESFATVEKVIYRDDTKSWPMWDVLSGSYCHKSYKYKTDAEQHAGAINAAAEFWFVQCMKPVLDKLDFIATMKTTSVFGEPVFLGSVATKPVTKRVRRKP